LTVKKFRTPHGVVYCKDLVWRVQRTGAPTEVLSVDAAAKRLGVTPTFLTEWCKAWAGGKHATAATIARPASHPTPRPVSRGKSRPRGATQRWLEKVRTPMTSNADGIERLKSLGANWHCGGE
jgi:hypothetical protein